MATSGKKLALLVEQNALHADEHLLTIVKGQIVTGWTTMQAAAAVVLVVSTVLALFVSPLFWTGWLAIVYIISSSTGYGGLAVTDHSLYVLRDGFLRPEIVSSGPLEDKHFAGEKLKTVEVGGTRFKFKSGYEKRFHKALEPLRSTGPIVSNPPI